MPALIIIAKILVAAIAAYRIYKIVMFYRSDSNVRLSFDLLSTIEIDAVIGLTIISLLARITETTYVFTLVLCLLAAVLNCFHLFRLVIAGDKKIMLRQKTYELKKIKGMNASGFTLNVYLKNGEKLKVMVPLTKNEVIRKMNYLK